MSVELDPPELHFKRMCFLCGQDKRRSQELTNSTGPFNREVSQVLRLQNPHSDPVAFKVRILMEALRMQSLTSLRHR